MARREVPAVHILKQDRGPQGVVEIMSCAAHMFRTIAELRSGHDALIQPLKADPSLHGCKGCLEDW